jgi:glycosyltransferase involved in cell wall biosynthesis
MADQRCHLVMLGQGPDQSKVEDVTKDLGMACRVHLVGRVSDVRPYVVGSSALVHASLREGLPKSIMEALSLEVPVVCSAARGSRELVGADAGFVVPIGDTRSMGRAMDRILAEPDAARAMGQRGRVRMRQRYDISLLIDLHTSLYEQLARSRGRDIGAARTRGPDTA